MSDHLVLGGEYDFIERADGYDALIDMYGFNFKDILSLDITLKYQAFEGDQIDVVVMGTTDGSISTLDGVILEDDKSFFLTYEAATVVRKDTLEQYSQLEPVLLMLKGQITEEEMSAMNYDVEVNKRDDSTVAREFLISKGLLKEATEHE